MAKVAASAERTIDAPGFFERTFAPRALHKLFLDELDRLNAYAREPHVS
ncbi:MAG: hypothetical protein ACRDOI_39585 [Trebonia sp.]